MTTMHRHASRLAFAFAALAGSLALPASAQTQFTTGGIEVRAFLARSSTSVYAAGYGSGLYQSSNAGASWARVNNLGGANVRYLTSLAGNTSSTLVVGAEEGLLTSTDGTSFIQRLFEPVSAVAMAPGGSTTVLAAVKGVGILRSTNSGVTFTLADNSGFSGTDITALAEDPSNGNIFYAAAKPDGAGNRGGIFRSTNAGASWSASTAIDAGGSINQVFGLAVDNSGNVYAAVQRVNGTGGIYKQTGGVGAWTQQGNTFGSVSVHRDANSTNIWGGGRNLGVLMQTGGAGSFNYMAPNNGGNPSFFYTAVNAIVTMSGGSQVAMMALKGAGVWRSTAAGSPRTWTQVRFPGAERTLSAAGVAGSPNSILFGLHAGGVWRSDTAGNASSTFNPPTVTAGQADFSIAAGPTAVNIFTSVWSLAASPGNANLIYAAAGNVGMHYGNDAPGVWRWNGAAWTGIGSAAPAGAPYNIVQESGSIFMPSQPVYGVELNSADDTVVYASYLGSGFGSIRRLANATWTIIGIPGTIPQVREHISSLAPTNVIALPFDDKPVYSTDYGASYIQASVSQNGFERLRFFQAVEDPLNIWRWIAASNKGLYRSIDYGASWGRVAAPVFQKAAMSAVGFKPGVNRFFAADFAGNRYCSSDAVNWVSAGAALRAGVNAIRTVNGQLYYLTDGAGAFREDGSC